MPALNRVLGMPEESELIHCIYDHAHLSFPPPLTLSHSLWLQQSPPRRPAGDGADFKMQVLEGLHRILAIKEMTNATWLLV